MNPYPSDPADGVRTLQTDLTPYAPGAPGDRGLSHLDPAPCPPAERARAGPANHRNGASSERSGPLGEEATGATDLVGRPGLDPGTLGLKVPCSSG